MNIQIPQPTVIEMLLEEIVGAQEDLKFPEDAEHKAWIEGYIDGISHALQVIRLNKD